MTAKDLKDTKEVLAVPVDNKGGDRYISGVCRVPAGKTEVFFTPDYSVKDLPEMAQSTWSPKKANKQTVPKLAAYSRKGKKGVVEFYGPRDSILTMPGAPAAGGD